jgi:hypothetical protein
LVVALGSVALACGKAAAPVAPGGTCEQATDCEEGYVCITQASGARLCSADLDAIASVETQSDAGPADTGAKQDATTPKDSSPPQDSTTPKDSTPPPQDSSPPQDSTPPPVDAPAETAPPVDAPTG